MIKISYIIEQLAKGGAERQLFELVKGIDRNRFIPMVICLSQGGYWAAEIRKLNIQVIELPTGKKREFAILFKLVKLLKATQPDLVHTYLWSANTYGRIAAILSKVPTIIASERNLTEIGKDKNIYMICIDRLLALFSNGIICNSNKASESLINNYSFDPEKVFTVHNGIDIDNFLKRTMISSRKKLAQKVVGTIGRLFPQKNYRLFLDVAKIVLDRFEDESIKFLIIGEGPLRNELVMYSKDLGIGDFLIFTGEREDIPQLLKNMDIFVMTSIYEGLPNAIIEAMASGLPVITTDVGGNGELVIDGETGFLCQTNDKVLIASRVIDLINDEMKARRMGEHGKKRILNEFGVEKMVKDTEQIYLKLLES